MTPKKKKTAIIIITIVAALVIIYIICALTGNLKPADETPSSTIESSQSNSDEISSLEFGESDNFGIKEMGGQVLSWVEVNTDNYNVEDLEIVVVKPEIADIQFTDQSGKNQWFRIVAKESGRTGFYIQTKDGTVKTETKVISVDRTPEELAALDN